MIGSSVASWAAITAAGGASFNPELAFGIAAPLAGAVVSWRAVERTYARAPERVTSVLVAGLAAKMVCFGLYVGLLGALWLRPTPLVAEPSGEADVEVELEVALERGAVAGEAVDHAACEPAAIALEQAREVVVRLALVEEEGLA